MQPEPPRIWDTGKGLTVRCGGRLLYSGVDPSAGVLRRIDALARAGLPPRSLLFVPSLGLGHGLAELVATAPASCHVLCVESDQQLFAAACGLDPRLFPEHPRLTVVRADDPRPVASLLQRLGAGRFRRVVSVPLCAGYDLDRDRYDRMAAALSDTIRVHWQNRMTLIRMGRLWIRNLESNLAALPRAADWTSLRGESPVVVAGAGPSLEGRLDWIAGHRSRLRLLAVDTALPVLADAGLVPDIVFALEAQWVNLEDFLGTRLDSCSVIADMTATPSLLRRAPRLYVCASRFAPVALLARLEAAGLCPTAIPPLGSVGVAALHVALRLTDGPVLAAGLDFAYTRSRSHARGAPAMRAALAAANRLSPADSAAAGALLARRPVRVGGKRGEPCLTDMVLQGYAGEAARISGEAAGRVIDLDAGGLDKGGLLLDDAALEAVLAAQPGPEAAASAGAAAAAAPAWDSEAVLRFIGAETELLERAADRVAGLLEGPEGGSLDAEAGSLLQAVDYLYMHFPDTTPLAEAGRSFLARLAREAADARQGWRRAAALAAGPLPD